MNKTHQSNFFKKKLFDNSSQMLTPEHSIANYTFKNKRNFLFNKTSNLFFSSNSVYSCDKNNKFTKLNSNKKLFSAKTIKMRKLLSEIFKNNDIDFVRNLNIDSLSKFNNNLILKENLKNSNKNYFEIEKQKKLNKIIKLKIGSNGMKKRNERFPKMDRNSINSSSNSIKEKNKGFELNDITERDLMKKFKMLKQNDKMLNSEKKAYFLKIKEIDKEIGEIKEESLFIKTIYFKEVNEPIKNKNNEINILDEIIKYKIKMKEKYIKNNKNFLHVMNMKMLIKKNNNKSDESSKDIKNKNKNKKENSNNKSNHNEENNLEIFEENIKKSNEKKKIRELIKTEEDKIDELLSEKKNIESQIKDIEISLEEIRNEMKEISDKLMLSYKESLYRGTHVRNEGLVWLIKSIWTLGQNVPMSFMPDFLDCESIDFLFKLARKENLLEKLELKIFEIKLKLKKKLNKKSLYLNSPLINSNKIKINKNLTVKEKLLLIMEKESKLLKKESRKDVYNDLVNQFKKNKLMPEIEKMPEAQIINKLKEEMEILKKEIEDLKQKEIKRIYNCFLEQNYEDKFHTSIETVLAALIGTEGKEEEINKYNSLKKNYISEIKRIRFFDHIYTRK